MASRESQGMQIGLIICVMLNLVLLVVCYVLYRRADEQFNLAVAAEDSLATAEETRGRALLESQNLKEMLGYDPAAGLEEIRTNFDREMKLFGSDYPASDPRHYRTLPIYLLGAVTSRHEQLVAAVDRERVLRKEKEDAEARETAKREEAEQAQAAAVATLAQEREKFNTELAKLRTELARLQEELSTKEKEHGALVSTLSKDIQSLQSRVLEKETLIAGLQAKLAGLTPETFARADGSVTFVSQSAGTVWINLGFADGLSPQVTFSVYDRDESNRTPDSIKGEIEVTRIRDAHLAEARIISDDVGNPILKGDMIFTPAWTPGTRQRFAFTGVLDLDGDGSATPAEHERIRSLIAINNGLVDAEMLPDGKVTGAMSINTRYLVRGAPPASGEPNAEEIRTGITTMLNNAQDLGIEQIALDHFLSLMGYRRSARSVPLGGRAEARDFINPDAETGGVQAREAGGFRPRKPPARGRGGAF